MSSVASRDHEPDLFRILSPRSAPTMLLCQIKQSLLQWLVRNFNNLLVDVRYDFLKYFLDLCLVLWLHSDLLRRRASSANHPRSAFSMTNHDLCLGTSPVVGILLIGLQRVLDGRE